MTAVRPAVELQENGFGANKLIALQRPRTMIVKDKISEICVIYVQMRRQDANQVHLGRR